MGGKVVSYAAQKGGEYGWKSCKLRSTQGRSNMGGKVVTHAAQKGRVIRKVKL